MKYVFFLIIFALVSCSDSNSKPTENSSEGSVRSDTIARKSELPKALQNWLAYYQVDNPAFSEAQFRSTEISPISYSESQTIILNE